MPLTCRFGVQALLWVALPKWKGHFPFVIWSCRNRWAIVPCGIDCLLLSSLHYRDALRSHHLSLRDVVPMDYILSSSGACKSHLPLERGQNKDLADSEPTWLRIRINTIDSTKSYLAMKLQMLVLLTWYWLSPDEHSICLAKASKRCLLSSNPKAKIRQKQDGDKIVEQFRVDCIANLFTIVSLFAGIELHAQVSHWWEAAFCVDRQVTKAWWLSPSQPSSMFFLQGSTYNATNTSNSFDSCKKLPSIILRINAAGTINKIGQQQLGSAVNDLQGMLRKWGFRAYSYCHCLVIFLWSCHTSFTIVFCTQW